MELVGNASVQDRVSLPTVISTVTMPSANISLRRIRGCPRSLVAWITVPERGERVRGPAPTGTTRSRTVSATLVIVESPPNPMFLIPFSALFSVRVVSAPVSPVTVVKPARLWRMGIPSTDVEPYDAVAMLTEAVVSGS